MARGKKKAPAPTGGVRASTRRAKLARAQGVQDDWRAFNPLKEPPKVTHKHRTTFELVENTDKKKRLEFEITTDRHPPPGFEFVPAGHPTLSQLCKDLSREQDAMIFIVSGARDPDNLTHHVHRAGIHFRQVIVDQARLKLLKEGIPIDITHAHRPGQPEPIPTTQREIDRQANAVLKDLFPRIPHTDRREIVHHAFRMNDESKVGMAQDLTLVRRVQLAAAAHIRHRYTRYDDILKETNWSNARKAVEKTCLDIIVKWRGDEETGRDQLDEILREVIEISDTEEESEESEESEDETPVAEPVPTSAMPTAATPTAATSRYTPEPQNLRPADQQSALQANGRNASIPVALTSPRQRAITKAGKRTPRRTRRFRRYAAAAKALAGATNRNGGTIDPNVGPFRTVPADLPRSPGSVRLDSSREPQVAARSTPQLEQTIPRRYEMRSHPFNGDSRREEMATTVPRISPHPHEHASLRPMQDPEDYRPKVGYRYTSASRIQYPLPPVGNGLQDMLLQSIEPPSPAGTREQQNAPRFLDGEPRQLEDSHRLDPRLVYETADSIPPPHSPRTVRNGDELVTRLHDVAGYPPRDADLYPGSFQINRQDRGEEPHHTATRFIAHRPILSQNHPWPQSGQGVAPCNGDEPHRSRARPIFIDDDVMSSQPRQVLEVQRHPDDVYQVPALRRDPMRDIPARRDTHTQDGREIVYPDRAPVRPTTPIGHYHGLASHANGPSHGLPTYENPNTHMVPMTEPRRRHVVDDPPGHEPSLHREPLRSRDLAGEPVDWPGNVSREFRVVPLGPDHEVCRTRYTSTQYDIRQRPTRAPIPYPSQARQENHLYRLDQPGEAMVPQMEYVRNHEYPPLVAPPPHGDYIETHHLPERRRVVYVDY
ncbi:hypothetical protein GGR54DRAFT_581959 [Hypoxylon sp. NC1633]|nr:hypothetical protein GGR54DRAFT_581959 [Hypoxylon sp. NC1633]